MYYQKGDFDMTLFQGLLAILWPVTGAIQAFILAPEMFFYAIEKFLTTGHL